MRSRFLYIVLIFSFFACISNTSFAQSVHNTKQNIIGKHESDKQLIITAGVQYEYANELFNAHDYGTAIVEFKRFIHFFPQNSQREQAEFNIAVCLFNLKKYHHAARAFNEIIIKGRENNITKQSIFFQSQAFLNLGNIGYAQIVLQNYLKLVDDTEDIETKDRIYFNLAQIYLSLAKKNKPSKVGELSQPSPLAMARKYLLKISKSNADKYRTKQYLDLVLRAEYAPKKNPATAGLFAIVPGAGFLYCERYHDAFITFLLNAGLMAAAFEAWDDNKALAGVIGFVETG
ncbi:MAG: hypothetical protein GY857_19670, partial [Desulfobacula sp.]|nr:hypothetical protein [Desulfobacula sp.]